MSQADYAFTANEKPPSVKAIRVGLHNIQQVMEFVGKVKHINVNSDKDSPLTILTEDKSLVVKRGDYLVRDDVGSIYAMTNTAFHEKYDAPMGY